MEISVWIFFKLQECSVSKHYAMIQYKKKTFFKDNLRANSENLKLSKQLLHQIKLERKNCLSVVKNIVIPSLFKYICKY